MKKVPYIKIIKGIPTLKKDEQNVIVCVHGALNYNSVPNQHGPPLEASQRRVKIKY